MKHNLSLAQPYSKIKDQNPFIRAAGQNAPSLRERFVTAFQARGLKPTPQALCAIIESINRSPSELVGNTDSLLVGLLYSGSYTVDILETAGVPLSIIQKLANDSLSVFQWADQSVDPVDSFFHEFGFRLGPIVSGNSLLETSHLLAAAISPYDETNLAESGSLPTDATFPFHL